ncbi:MAG: hypothetical protein SFV23_00190 [Planctomycetaceae bacterium]|nr:hypothetical protein [Planctomycetaceae bacterium]
MEPTPLSARPESSVRELGPTSEAVDPVEARDPLIEAFGSREALMQAIEQGVSDLENGRYLEFDDESLEAYFEQLKDRITERAAHRVSE